MLKLEWVKPGGVELFERIRVSAGAFIRNRLPIFAADQGGNLLYLLLENAVKRGGWGIETMVRGTFRPD